MTNIPMGSVLIVETKNTETVVLHRNPCQRLLSINKGKWILFILLFTLTVGYDIAVKYCRRLNKISDQSTSISQQNLLDGCAYVYIDLGTNIGV